METFKELIDQKLKKAKPLTTGIGLYKYNTKLPKLHPSNIPTEPIPPARPPDPIEPPRIKEIETLAENVEQLKAKALKIERKLESQPWLSQAMDLLCVWIIFLLFPLISLLVLPISSSRLLFEPSVVFLFSLIYLFLLAGYLWGFNFFAVPTIGMIYQNMQTWPNNWKWKEDQFLPAFKRALGHLTLDALWRRR